MSIMHKTDTVSIISVFLRFVCPQTNDDANFIVILQDESSKPSKTLPDQGGHSGFPQVLIYSRIEMFCEKLYYEDLT